MSVIGIASIVILVLIFLKVPVFVSLLCGSMTYFMLTPGIATQLFAQRMLAGMSNMALLAVPFFCLCRCLYELFRRHQTSHGLLPAADPPNEWRTGTSQRITVHLDGRTLRLELSRRRHGSKNAGSGNGGQGIQQRVFYGYHCNIFHYYPSDSAWNCHDPLWLDRQCLHRKALYCRHRPQSASVLISHDFSILH